MILVIRIAGQVNMNEDVKETLKRINLKRKYSAILMKDSQENLKLLIKIRSFVSYGTIKTETLAKLLAARAMPIKTGAKIDEKKVMSEIDKKSLVELGVKPIFRLHPPRKGIDSKKYANEKGKGVLGENKNINELVERML